MTRSRALLELQVLFNMTAKPRLHVERAYHADPARVEEQKRENEPAYHLASEIVASRFSTHCLKTPNKASVFTGIVAARSAAVLGSLHSSPMSMFDSSANSSICSGGGASAFAYSSSHLLPAAVNSSLVMASVT